MEGTVFVGAVVIAVVDALKDVSPRIKGFVTVVVAGLIGGLIALLDVQIGLTDLSIAEGVMAGLASAGVVGVAKRVG